MDSFIDFYNQLLSNDAFSYEIGMNSIRDWLEALALFIALLVIFGLVRWIILRRVAKLVECTATDLDDALIEVVKSINPPFYSVLAFYFALQRVTLPSIVTSVFNVIIIVYVIYRAIFIVQIVIDHIIRKWLLKVEGENAQSAVALLSKIAKGILWVIGFLMVLSNFGVNITSLVAGLGIAGLAIALALQNVLSDVFSSFSILFDKPFKVGDFIVVGSHFGTVEKIGIKTTRLRALQGEEIVISNQELTSTRVQNFKKMKERRVVISFGVTYETPQAKMKKSPSLLMILLRE